MKMKTKVFLSVAISAVALVGAVAGSLEPPPGPVSPTRPPDKCFDNTSRLVDCGNGTVKDNETGLFWLKNADCFGTRDWATANIKAAELGHGQCGLTDGSLPGDWRLPTLGCASSFCLPIYTATGEFPTIFGADCTAAPYVLNRAGTGCWTEGNPFTGVQSFNYWSSATDPATPIGGLWVGLNGNFVTAGVSKTNAVHVWPVRGGP